MHHFHLFGEEALIGMGQDHMVTVRKDPAEGLERLPSHDDGVAGRGLPEKLHVGGQMPDEVSVFPEFVGTADGGDDGEHNSPPLDIRE